MIDLLCYPKCTFRTYVAGRAAEEDAGWSRYWEERVHYQPHKG